MRLGHLNATDVFEDSNLIPKHMFFTSTGRIGVVIDASDSMSMDLSSLQRNIAGRIRGPGDTDHSRYAITVH